MCSAYPRVIKGPVFCHRIFQDYQTKILHMERILGCKNEFMLLANNPSPILKKLRTIIVCLSPKSM